MSAARVSMSSIARLSCTSSSAELVGLSALLSGVEYAVLLPVLWYRLSLSSTKGRIRVKADGKIPDTCRQKQQQQ